MIELIWTETQSVREPGGGDTVDLAFGILRLDIVEADSYQVSSLVTEHSIEGREQITDHHVPQIDRASVDVVVSRSAISLDLSADGTTRGEVELPSGGSATVIMTPDGATRDLDAFETLRRLCKDGTDVDVSGLRRPLEGWLISEVSSPRSVQDAGVMVCTLYLQEVLTASSSEVDAPAPRVERARPNTNRGNQPGRETRDSEVSTDPVGRDTGTSTIREDFGWNTETGEVF